MKNYFFTILACFPFLSWSTPVEMPRVDAGLFINNPKTDFENIFIQQPEKLKNAVAWLFEADKLSHDWTKSLDLSFKFDKYWSLFYEKWHLIDMNNDGQPELLFSGKPSESDEKEQFSLFVQFGSIWKEMYWDDGHLLSYKIHPRTKEILLYHHRYPCCSQATHAVIRLRYLNTKIHQMKRYFLARDRGMKGVFFPKQSDFKKNYNHLKAKTMLYWSKGKITKDAMQYVEKNEIIHYPKGSLFKILAREENWMYVQMISPPIIEKSTVVNAVNLKDVKFFGWIEAL